MTVIRPNSISGITSITAQANEINVFKSDGTLAGLSLNGVNVNTTTGISTYAALNVTGNISIGGTLTYQDVTNVDSLGIGTFRTGIKVLGGGINAVGVITATSFSGSGANLTGIDTDLVSDTSPQLGGSLDTNGNNINFGDNDRIVMGDAGLSDSHMRWDGTHLQIASANQARFSCSGLSVVNLAGTETQLTTTENGGVNLYHNNTLVCNTASYGLQLQDGMDIQITDSDYLYLGNAGDMALYHDGTDNHIRSDQTLNINFGTETLAKFIPNGGVQQYYNNILKTETTNSGLRVHGHLDIEDNDQIRIGTSDDLKIFHQGFNYIESHNDKEVHINAYTGGAVENMAKFKPNAEVELYFNGSNKLETKSQGVHISGELDIHGHIYPYPSNTYDLGTTNYRWRNIYTNDLNLSNKGSTNSVDNTWGDYTIQEGESDLFLINNRSGKKYKFNLTEVK